jgi:hypothetical protein
MVMLVNLYVSLNHMVSRQAHVVENNLGKTKVIDQIIVLNRKVRKLASAPCPVLTGMTHQVHPLVQAQEDQMHIRHLPSRSFRPYFLLVSIFSGEILTGLSPAAFFSRSSMKSFQRDPPKGVPSALGTG